MKISLSKQDITEKEIAAVNEVLRSSALSLGPKLPEFEEKLAAFVGAKYAVAVNSGTSALHLCIRALDIGEGDEVITTPFSFIASANCMIFERAKPVFVDIEPDTLNIDTEKIEQMITPKTKAILPVHVFGLPANMKKIMSLAEKYKLAVIEDSCEALGAKVGDKFAGTIGDCGTFAFYPNKQITTGEGGIIVTNREDIAALARSMRNQGRDDGMGWLAHARLGFNYRISDINCALGIAQIERVEEILSMRANVAKKYNEIIENEIPEIIPLCEPPENTTRSWFVYVVQLPEKYSVEQRDEIIKKLRAAGIWCNNYFPPIHLQPFYVEKFGYKKGDFPITENVSEKTIALPFYNRLTDTEIETVVRELKKIIVSV